MNGLIETEIADVPDIEPTAKPVVPVAVPVTDLVRHTQTDPSVLLGSRFLCRMGTLLLCGPTGVGKSSLARQFAFSFAIGAECFGIKPARRLKSLIIQAENDDGDEAEIRDGVFAGLQLRQGDQVRVGQNVVIAREDERSGIAFLTHTVRALLELHKPDLLWIDPALSFLGGDTNSQKDVGGFLRNGLNPLLREFNCGCVIVHHTNKPPTGKEKSTWQGGDFAYLGSGSAEWANHARAVLALRSIGSREVYELQAGKRGSRLGWQDKDGQKAFAKYLAHATEPGVICWHEVDPEVMETGRPKQFNADELYDLLPPEGLTAGEWQKSAADECGIKGATFHRQRRELQKADRIIKSKASGKWQPVTKKS